jgi:hypothetical protein
VAAGERWFAAEVARKLSEKGHETAAKDLEARLAAIRSTP